MSRLELLLNQWRLELGLLRRRVRDNRIGDACRFEPLIKVYSFLIKRYGDPEEPVHWLSQIARTIAIAFAILVLLSSFAGLWLHLLTGGQFWSWLQDQLAD
jgi:hypothetical protein